MDGLVSLIIPAHNESENIGPLVAAAAGVLPKLARRFEIVVVDDGSTDDTVGVATAALPPDSPGEVRSVRHAQKMGYGLTVGDGLRAARGDIIGFIDGDGQFDVRDLLKLSPRLRDSPFVTGRRRIRQDNWKRKITSGVFNVLVTVLYRLRYRDVDCALKLMTRPFLQRAMPLVSRSALLNTELYVKARRMGVTPIQVEVPHYPRLAGVHSGGRLIPILRAIRELILLGWRIRQGERSHDADAP